jgi:hypothetical protein
MNDISAFDSPAELIRADRATELANAEELHRLHGKYLRFHVDRGEYYVWNGRQWQRDIGGQVNRWAKETARASSDRLHECVSDRERAKFQKTSGERPRHRRRDEAA